MTTLYIIGNGFDLNLGLKTSYIDFIKSEEFKKNSDKELFRYLNSINEASNWVDIEAELVNYSNQRKSHQSFLNDYKALCKSLQIYISSIDTTKIDKKSAAFNLFSELNFKDDFKVINFNYTDSIRQVLKLQAWSRDPSEKIINIHGKADAEIIFGVDDNARINKQDSFLYKSFNRIFNPKIAKDLLTNFNSVNIFGHSLGDSDESYFDFFGKIKFQQTGGKKINLYHYGESSLISLYTQIHSLTNGGIAALKTHNEFKCIDVSETN